MRGTAPVTLALALCLAGCVDDDGGFVIVQNQAMGSSCSIESSASDIALWGGIFDVSVASGDFGYFMNPLLANNLASTASSSNPERNVLQMSRFDVSVDTVDVAATLEPFSIPASGQIDPGGSAVFRNVQVLRPQDVQALAPGVTANAQAVVIVKLRAVASHGGDDIDTPEFQFPVTLCNGCLVIELASCPAAGSTIKIVSNPCGLPQDRTVTCCKDSEGKPICLAGSSTS